MWLERALFLQFPMFVFVPGRHSNVGRGEGKKQDREGRVSEGDVDEQGPKVDVDGSSPVDFDGRKKVSKRTGRRRYQVHRRCIFQALPLVESNITKICRHLSPFSSQVLPTPPSNPHFQPFLLTSSLYSHRQETMEPAPPNSAPAQHTNPAQPGALRTRSSSRTSSPHRGSRTPRGWAPWRSWPRRGWHWTSPGR